MSEIRPLSASDSRAGFASGHPDLDRFFRQYAGQNQFTHHIGATYVAVKKGAIVGYATVAAAHIEIENVPAALAKRLPRYPLPVLRLARLAVDVSARRKDTGSALLRHVFSLARTMADLAGCVGVVVDAKPDGVAFYEKLGFIALPAAEGVSPARPPTTPMFLRLAAIAPPQTRARRTPRR